MAMVTRVPFTSSAHFHKLSLLSSLTDGRLPEFSTLSSFSRNRNRRKGFAGFAVVAMADSGKSTVLVTGAGGRTGMVSYFPYFFALIPIENTV